MKQLRLLIAILLFSALTIFSSCNGQGQTSANNEVQKIAQGLAGDPVSQIDGEIRGIWQDSKHNLWFASNGNGVFKYDGKSIVNFTEKHGLSSNYVWMVQESNDGNIWLKTYLRSKGGEIAICRFDGYEFKTIQPDTAVVNYHFQNSDLLLDYYFDGKNLSIIQFPQTSPIQNVEDRPYHYDIYATCLDRAGNVWLGTCMAGLCKYDGRKYTWFANNELGAPIRDIFEDKNGTLWVGNNGGGLFRYDGQGFINFSKEKNLHNPDFEKNLIGNSGTMARIWKITQDKQGSLWVGTIDNGIWVYDGKVMTNYTTKDGLGTNAIWTIYHDNDDKIWVGTAGAGVYTFKGVVFEKFTILK